MGIPALVIKLDELDAAFGKAAGFEAVRSVGARVFGFFAIEVPGGLGLVRGVDDFGHAGLHAVGHFVLSDAGFDFGIELAAELPVVELVQLIEHGAAGLGADAVGIGKIEDGVLAREEVDPGMAGVEEARSPEAGVERLAPAVFTNHHDEIREVFVVGAEAVGEPGTDAGAACDLGSGLDKGDGGVVVDRVGIDVPHDADVVGDFVVPGNEGAHFLTALSVRGKLGADGSRHWDGGLMGGHPGLAATCVGWKFLAVVLAEVGLVVEEFELGRAAGLEKVNDALRFGGDFGAAENSVVGVVGEQGSQGHAADARGGLLEEVSAVNGEGVNGLRCHRIVLNL